METSLWATDKITTWKHALDRYDDVIEKQAVAKLSELDQWYQNELPVNIRARTIPHIVHHELVRLTEWKMARGVWRAPNLVLVKGNAPTTVVETSTDALQLIPHPTKPVATLATLAGVGPATASAVVAAIAPETYPFFDELVAAQVPSLGKVAWTMAFYGRYAIALRERAIAIGGRWTAAMVERALWANVGGKAGVPG